MLCSGGFIFLCADCGFKKNFLPFFYDCGSLIWNFWYGSSFENIFVYPLNLVTTLEDLLVIKISGGVPGGVQEI